MLVRRFRFEPTLPPKSGVSFARALLTAAIVALAISPAPAAGLCTNRPPGLISWWPGEGNANDVSGGNGGSLQGGVLFSVGEVGDAFIFDSDDDRVVIPNDLSLGVQPSGFTVDFWMKGIKNQPDPSLACVVEKSHGFTDYTGWAFHVFTVTGIPTFTIGTGTSFPQVDGTVDVLDGAFHHIAGSWGSGTMRLYVDGVLQGSAANASPANNGRDVNMGFTWGAGVPQRFFRGALDEVSLFNRELSAAEIQAIFQAGSAGICPPAGSCSTPVTREIPSRTPEPGDPNQRPIWVRTNVFIQVGDQLTITATGHVDDGGGFSAGPDGNGFVGDPQAQFPDWYQTVAHLSLVGRLRLLSDTTMTVALDDNANANGLSGPGFVGSAFSMVATASGSVELAVNDGDTGNNSGAFYASICPAHLLDAGDAMPRAGGLTVSPNPSRGLFRIAYSLPKEEAIRIQILDVGGRWIRTLVEGRQARGAHALDWDGRDAAGRPLGPGIYLVRTATPSQTRAARALLLR